MSLTVSIPNFNVHKVARNKYYVQAKDGQSALVSKSDLKKIAKANGGVVKHDNSLLKKVAVGVGAAAVLAAGVVFRKNIGKTAGKAVDKVKNSKLADKAHAVKNSASGLFGKVKEFSGKVFSNIASGLKKAFQVVKDFFVNVFKKTSNVGTKISDKAKQAMSSLKNVFHRNKQSKFGTVFDLGTSKNTVLSGEAKKAKTEAFSEMAKGFDKKAKAVSNNSSKWHSHFVKDHGVENVK